jgi:hypothetical protein
MGDRPAPGIECDRADIVGQHGEAPIVKPGGHRRFARAGVAEEPDRLALDDDRIGVQWQQAALVQDRRECRTEQVEAKIALRPGFIRVNQHFAPAPHSVAGDARYGEHRFVTLDSQHLGIIIDGDLAAPDCYVRLSLAFRGPEFG